MKKVIVTATLFLATAFATSSVYAQAYTILPEESPLENLTCDQAPMSTLIETRTIDVQTIEDTVAVEEKMDELKAKYPQIKIENSRTTLVRTVEGQMALVDNIPFIMASGPCAEMKKYMEEMYENYGAARLH